MKLEMQNKPASTGSRGADTVDKPITSLVSGYFTAKITSTAEVKNAITQADFGV